MIEEILDLPIKHIKGAFKSPDRNVERKYWRSRIKFNYKSTSLGFFNDPFSAGLVYTLVKKELNPNIDFENMFIVKKERGKYMIQKTINWKTISFGTFDSLEEAKAERDLLIKFNWDIEKVCECVDETVNGKIIVNNKVVGMVEV